MDYQELKDTYGDLVDIQISLEEEMLGLGIQRERGQVTRAKQDGTESGTGYGNALVKTAIDPVAEGIKAHIGASRKGGPRPTSILVLSQFDPYVAALIALRVVIDGVSTHRPLSSLAVTIGLRLEHEWRFRKLEEHAPRLAGWVQRRAAKATTYRHRAAILTTTLGRQEIEEAPWSDHYRAATGMALVDIVMQTTGIIQIEDQTISKNRIRKVVVGTPKTLKWAEEMSARREVLFPSWLPTVIPPRDWTGAMEGGYWTNALPQQPLVKRLNRNDPYLHELDDRLPQLETVRTAINAIQRTPWQINTQVLEVMQEAWDRGVAVAGLPDREDNLHVQCPRCNGWVQIGSQHSGRRDKWKHGCFDDDPEVLRTWKKRAAAVHETNISARSRRLHILRSLHTAERFAQFDRIWFPHQLDFRGRLYAIPSLNPQGHDTTKGLLRFGEGKRLGDGVAAGWLAIHGANLWGNDKVSLEDRISWVEDRNDWVQTIADDPLGTIHEWAEADKPWQFLSWCFEWAGFLRDGYDHVSHIPVQMDGSCSGIQHFSAMLRDQVGGAAVNLVPADKPADIYARVAQVVTAKLCSDLSTPAKEGDEERHEILSRLKETEIDRKATKRQVMTLPYGAGAHSCREYTQEWLEEYRPDAFTADERFKVSQILGTYIWDSIGEVVIAARAAMSWLQECAKVVTDQGLPVYWTTAIGFPVQQKYFKTNHREVKTKLGDKMVRVFLADPTDQIDTRRMRNGISPNFVHSNDACHLMLSTELAEYNGITSYSMIHDSFGTHAADAEMLGRCLRTAFVDLYLNHDVLAEFRDQIVSQVPEDQRDQIPPLPRKGTLDITQVMESDFFFA